MVKKKKKQSSIGRKQIRDFRILSAIYKFLGPTRSTAADRKETVSQTSSDQINGSTSTNIIPSIVSQIGKNDNSSKFTTSNFVESVITPSESVFADMQKSKKRKHNEQSSSPVNIDCIPESELNSSKLSINQDEEIDDEDSTLHFIEEPNLSTLKPEIVKTSTEIFPSSTSSMYDTKFLYTHEL